MKSTALFPLPPMISAVFMHEIENLTTCNSNRIGIELTVVNSKCFWYQPSLLGIIHGIFA